MSLRQSKWFCPEPFSNIFITTDGAAAPCCVSGHWPLKEHQTHNIKDWSKVQNSKYFKGLREDLSKGAGDFISNYCSWCYKNEEAGRKSHRQNYVERLTDEEWDLLDKAYLDKNNYKPPIIKSMQIKALAGNYCNLSCQMCLASESSGLALENRKLGIEDNHPLDRPAKYLFPWDQNGLEEYLRKTQILKLVGGETLAIKANYDILKTCIDKKISDNISVEIITNATIFPKFDNYDIFDYIPFFKNFNITCSVEIWGEENDYIRYPSKWKETEKNIYRLNETNANVAVASTVNALNIGYLNKMKFPRYSFMSVVSADNPFSITSIPPDIRQNLNILPEHKELLNVFKYDKNNMDKMLEVIRKRDQFRGTKLTDVFPEWDHYY